jgi:hypothetical protein
MRYLIAPLRSQLEKLASKLFEEALLRGSGDDGFARNGIAERDSQRVERDVSLEVSRCSRDEVGKAVVFVEGRGEDHDARPRERVGNSTRRDDRRPGKIGRKDAEVGLFRDGCRDGS